MPTHQDETLPQRYAREHQDYLKLSGSMTAEQVADIQLQLHNSIAREQALQQRLTAADERADVLEGLLREARHNHGLMLMSDPPRDAWKHHRMNERIDAALKPAEGRKPSTCTWSEGGFSWHTGCGKEWQFTDGGLPSENGMRFCHSCGKTLVVKSAESP